MKSIEEVDPREAFERIGAAMAEAIDAEEGSRELEALKRMIKLAGSVYKKNFAETESVFNFSLFIAVLVELQIDNYEKGGLRVQ